MEKYIKKAKKVFKQYVTKKNIIISTISLVSIGAVLQLGGYEYLNSIFSSRAGTVGLNPDDELDIADFQKPNQCPKLYPWGAPEIKDKQVNERSLYMCRTSYAVQYDPKTKVPLWEVEILDKNNVVSFNVPSSFIPTIDPNIPKKMQATLKQYTNSVYKLGYLAPIENMYINNKDMPIEELEALNKKSLKESLYMTNAIPEAKATGVIKTMIDMQIRTMVHQRDPLYLVSGVVFLNGKTNGYIGEGEDKIAIPTHIYKLITYPSTYGSVAYLIPNTENMSCGNNCTPENFIVPIKELERVAGVEFFSKLGPYYAVQVRQDVNEMQRKKIGN